LKEPSTLRQRLEFTGARAYIRYAPWTAGKSRLWRRARKWKSDFAVRTIFGARMAGNTEDIIQRYIYFFGVWEPTLTRWLATRLKAGDVFVDVGANVGYFSLLASRLVGRRGLVIAVEASPDVVRRLRLNLDLNGAANVKVVNMAAAAKPGTLLLFRGPSRNLGLSCVLETDQRSLAQQVCTFDQAIPAAPLSEIVPRSDWRRVRIIKVDVEGAEASVVAGMLPILGEGRPDLELMVEVVPDALRAQGRTPADVLNQLAAFGFRPYLLPNCCEAEYYLNGHRPEPIRPLIDPVDAETDVIFSRVLTG
jgi:FkbM family methyltransferase